MPLNFAEELSEKDLAKSVTEFVVWPDTVLYIDQTVEEAFQVLRKRKIVSKVTYFYVVDRESILLGLVPARLLIFSPPKTKIGDIMLQNIVSLPKDRLMKDALPLFAQHRLLAIPVVTSQNVLLGIIELVPSRETLTLAPLHVDKKTADDIFQLIGLSIEQGHMRSLWSEYRFRMPWLFCNLFAGLVCAFIAESFHDVLNQMIVIAMFIPLVLTLSESIAMQSMTLGLRFLHHTRISWKGFRIRLIKDIQSSVFMGLTCGAIACLSYFYFGDASWNAFLAISQSILLTMVMAAAFGTILPIGLHALDLDPKVAAGPVVLMCVDIAATAIYLGNASFWLV